MKKSVDIEKLVQWALREELPKGRAVSTSAWDLISSYAALGTRVDTSRGSGDGLGFVAGEPHADAGVIAYAIEMLPSASRFDDRIEVEALFGDLAAIAGDAIDAIMYATFNPRAIVLSKAILGSRPKWDFEHPTPYRMTLQFRDAVGSLRERPRVVGTDADGAIVDLMPRRGKAAMVRGVYDLALSPRSPLQWGDPSLISIGHARAEYVAWHNALVRLATALAGSLADHAATMPSASRAPWLTGDDAPTARVFVASCASVGSVALPLQPKRAAPAAQSRESPKLRSQRLAKAADASLRKREEMASK